MEDPIRPQAGDEAPNRGGICQIAEDKVELVGSCLFGDSVGQFTGRPNVPTARNAVQSASGGQIAQVVHPTAPPVGSEYLDAGEGQEVLGQVASGHSGHPSDQNAQPFISLPGPMARSPRFSACAWK